MTSSLHVRVPRVRMLAAVVAVLISAMALKAPPAFAHWSVSSVAGGGGTAAAATVAQGATPTAQVTGQAVTLAWAAVTVSTGRPVDGYLVHRYNATTLADQGSLTGCIGRLASTSCTEQNVPNGQWLYADTPVLSDNWRGVESPMSLPVTMTRTPPRNVLTATDSSGSVFKNADTVYYRGSVAGVLRLRNALTATGASPQSSTTAALGGSISGWDHTPSTVTTPTDGPYVSSPFSWTAGTYVTTTEVVTGGDTAGSSAETTLTFVNDSTAPGPDTISYQTGLHATGPVAVTFTTGTDSGSGIATQQLERASAPRTGMTCGTFGSYSSIGPNAPVSPYDDTTVLAGTCYQYRYLVTDHVGNQDRATSPSVAEIPAVVNAPPLGVDASFSVLGGTRVVSTGNTVVSGDLGVSPSTDITGFPPGIVAGSTHANDSLAMQGQIDLAAAYANAKNRTVTGTFAGDRIGATFDAGVWHSAGAFLLTGTMTLDGQGDPNALFIFQIDAAFSPAANSQMLLINGAKASNVYWQINGAVSTDANSRLAGTLLVNGAATLGAGSTWIGRVLAVGTVTLANNAIRFTAAPAPTISIDGGSPRKTKDPTPIITGTSSVPAGTPIKVTIDGQSLTTAVATGGSWSVKAATLTAGTYVVTVSVRDADGNAGNATQTLIDQINPAPVNLGRAASYSVLAGTGVASSGATTLSGDLGLSTSGAIIGFPPIIVTGHTQDKTTAAVNAQTDAAAAYSELAARAPIASFAGDLVGQTFQDGVYRAAAAITQTGNLILDAEGNADAIFIFQIAGALTPAASSTITLINGAKAANVYWVVAGAVSTGASSSFVGTILSQGAITLGDAGTLAGRALAQGTVTLSGNRVTG